MSASRPDWERWAGYGDGKSKAEETLDLIQKRIDRQIKTFEGYGAEQTKLLKDAVLEARGKFVFFAVSSKADELEKVFRESL